MEGIADLMRFSNAVVISDRYQQLHIDGHFVTMVQADGYVSRSLDSVKRISSISCRSYVMTLLAVSLLQQPPDRRPTHCRQADR